MTVNEIHSALRSLGGFYGVYVPEFTFGGRRVDAAIIDVSKRWIRGFEIKVSRSDFLRDEKWQEYTEFCSSLSIRLGCRMTTATISQVVDLGFFISYT